MRHFFTFLFLLLLSSFSMAQDTLTVMQYNLLYYGEPTSFCTLDNNNIEQKDPYLRTILDAVQPDIFTVNELSNDLSVHQHLLDENLNINGTNDYQKANLSNLAGSNIVNMLFFKSSKLRLKNQYTAQTLVRDIDVYELYYNSNDLAQGDTAFIVCVVAHLKAGNTSEDADVRRMMTQNAMTYLQNNFSDKNVLFMGDFNVYTGSEQAFQNLVNTDNPNMRFYDPVDAIGSWNNNSAFRNVHTQSTNSSSTGCAAGGGMDDRFDFILISDELHNASGNVRYVDESYHAVGQDGLHFNGSINGPPTNAAVSPEVAEALQNMSDHLPVTLKLRVDKTLSLNDQRTKPFLAQLSPNPTHDLLKIRFYNQKSENMVFEVLSMQGQLVFSEQGNYSAGSHIRTIKLGQLRKGIYLLRISDTAGKTEVSKLLIY